MVRFLGPAAAVVVVSLALASGCGGTSSQSPQVGGGSNAGAAGSSAAGTASGGMTFAGTSAGGSTGTSGAANGGSAGALGNSVADACIAYAVALCERRNECNATPQNNANCLSTSFSCPDVVNSTGSTRTAAVLQACAVAYRTFSCDDLSAGKLPDCVTPGTLARGAPCKYPSQCSTLDCKTGGGLPCGVCALMVGEGESCSAPDVDCLPEMHCEGGTCVKLPSQGPAALPGQSCVGRTCVPDYYCEPQSQLCAAEPSAGMSCETLACASSAYCGPDTQQCQPLPGKDEPCGATTYCGHDLACDISKMPAVCTPLLGPGADCTGLGNSACQSELRCLCPYGTPPGMPCAKSSCYSLRLGGEACDDVTSQCHPAFTCTAGKCVPKDSQGLLPMDCK